MTRTMLLPLTVMERPSGNCAVCTKIVRAGATGAMATCSMHARSLVGTAQCALAGGFDMRVDCRLRQPMT